MCLVPHLTTLHVMADQDGEINAHHESQIARAMGILGLELDIFYG